MKQPKRHRPHKLNQPNRRAPRLKQVVLPANMCELVTGVLHKSEDSSEFRALLTAAGDPSHKFEVGTVRFYNFAQCGLDLTYHMEHDKFWMATFEYDTAGVRAGEVQKYTGDLPAGIRWSDTCNEVEEKLGIMAYREGWVPGCTSHHCDIKSRNADYWKHYHFAHYEMTLIFESEDTGLGMVSLDRPI